MVIDQWSTSQQEWMKEGQESISKSQRNLINQGVLFRSPVSQGPPAAESATTASWKSQTKSSAIPICGEKTQFEIDTHNWVLLLVKGGCNLHVQASQRLAANTLDTRPKRHQNPKDVGNYPTIHGKDPTNSKISFRPWGTETNKNLYPIPLLEPRPRYLANDWRTKH